MTNVKPPIPAYEYVDGFPLPPKVSHDKFRSALKYKPEPGDVFIVTFPKCGTTWMQYIVANIYSHGKQFESASEYREKCTFLEFEGAQRAELMTRPCTIKTHLPFNMNPYSPEANYIYVARNPKDCCVSLYHHTKRLPLYQFKDGTFDDFFEIFIDGKTDFGDYFDNLMSWYEHKGDSNVLFLTYEGLKQDIQKEVLRIAEFLGTEYKEALLADSDLRSSVIRNSSFDIMKEVHQKEFENFRDLPQKRIGSNSDIPDAISSFSISKTDPLSSKKSNNKLRKGIVGDWKNYFSENQSKRLTDKFLQRAKGTELEELWVDCM